MVDTEKLPQRGRGRLVAALLAGIALALIAAEGLLRMLVAPASLLDPTSDAYWRALFRGEESLAADIEHDPRLGWRMRRDYHTDGVTHDAEGRRVTSSPLPIDAAKRPVVILGDSFSYGLGVRDGETYASGLAQSLRDRAVWNLAANGFGLDQQVLAFELDGARLAPALVVVGYFLDDFRRNGLSFREALKPRFVVDGGELRVEPQTIPPPDEVRASLRAAREPRWFTWAALCVAQRRLAGTHGGFASDAEFEVHARLSEGLLARLKQSTDALGAELLVLSIPHCAYDGYRDAPRIETAVEASCTKLAIPFVATRAACQEAEARGVTVYDANCHWNAAGHALVARLLVERVEALGLLR